MTLNSALMHHQINSTEYLKAFHAPSFEKVVVELLLIIRIFRLTLRFAVFKVNRYDNSDPCKTYIPTCKSYFPTQKRDPEGLLCAISGSPGQNVTVRHPGFLFPYSGLSSSKHPRAFSRPRRPAAATGSLPTHRQPPHPAFSLLPPGIWASSLIPNTRGLSLAPGIQTFSSQASAGFLSPRRPRSAISGVPGADVCGRPAPSHGSPDAGAAG